MDLLVNTRKQCVYRVEHSFHVFLKTFKGFIKIILEISRPTPNTLVWQEQRPLIYTIVASFVLLVFLRFNLELARTIGYIHYTCQRENDAPNSTQVNCRRQARDFLGLVTTAEATFSNVVAAQANVEVKPRGSYRYEFHSVIVTTAQGQEIWVEPPGMIAGKRGDPLTMQTIAQEVNQFVQSTDLHWSYSQWHRDVAANLGCFLFLTGFLGFALYALRAETGKVDYALESRTAVEGYGDATEFVFTRRHHGTQRQVVFMRTDILEMTVARHVVGGKHKRVVYTPLLRRQQARPIYLARSGAQLQGEALLYRVKEFIQAQAAADASVGWGWGPSAGENGENYGASIGPEPRALSREVWQGQHGRYATTDSIDLPTSSPARMRQAGVDFQNLGFNYMGDLQTSKFPGVALYAYLAPSLKSYAILYNVLGAYGGIDFYCTFANGSSLTTTSRMIVFFMNWGVPPVYFRCHFRADAPRLWDYHEQHVDELLGQLGDVRSAKPSLQALARTIDRHFTTRKGLLLAL